MTEIRIYQDLCKGTEECGICLHVCQKEVFSPSGTLNKKGFQPPRVVQDDQCSACENCMIFCPDLAIVVSGEKSQRRSKK